MLTNNRGLTTDVQSLSTLPLTPVDCYKCILKRPLSLYHTLENTITISDIYFSEAS